MFNREVVFVLIFSALKSLALYVDPILNNQITQQNSKSIELLFKNLSPADGHPGAILAAPSKIRPDYYYHWVRDAGLVTLALDSVYRANSSSRINNFLNSFFLNHINFNEIIQNSTAFKNGLGEPKFYVDGNPYLEPWGRPQNDGPAIRTLSMIQILDLAIKNKWPEAVKLSQKMYQPQLPANSILKKDLEYVGHHWTEASFDLWEEVLGMHFYTMMAQRKALLFGSQIAASYGDRSASAFYIQEAKKVANYLETYWSPQKGYIESTKFPIRSKVRSKSNLDLAVLLGVIHFDIDNSSFTINDPRVIATFNKLKSSFSSLYSINKNTKFGVAFGRYPEDTYDGYSTNSLGNPWVLGTTGAAEYLYRLIIKYKMSNSIYIDQINYLYFRSLAENQNLQPNTLVNSQSPLFQKILNSLLVEAESYMARVIYHRNPDGSLSEQINRDSGYMQGAPNLTWSHASFLTAKLYREQALNYLGITTSRQ